MQTASYFTFFGPGRVGISRGAPRGIKAGYRLYRTLAPSRDMLDMPLEPYRDKFFNDILGPLDAQQVYEELKSLAGEWEPTLLCFERPPFDRKNFCHRRMVAEWFERELSISVPEFEPSEEQRKIRASRHSDLFD